MCEFSRGNVSRYWMPLCLVQVWSEACYVIQSSQQSSETHMTIISMQEEKPGCWRSQSQHRMELGHQPRQSCPHVQCLKHWTELSPLTKCFPISEETCKFFLPIILLCHKSVICSFQNITIITLQLKRIPFPLHLLTSSAVFEVVFCWDLQSSLADCGPVSKRVGWPAEAT